MVDHELDELRREFLIEAAEKVSEMTATLSNEPSEALERLAYLAHQLKGSGGSYGYQRISTESAEIEKAVERIATGETSGATDKIRRHVENLRTEISRSMEELSARA
ncbi:MAG: Hpt domain-containing protein [Thermoanaerobaculia bacterium]